jgi:hypothetical protein
MSHDDLSVLNMVYAIQIITNHRNIIFHQTVDGKVISKLVLRKCVMTMAIGLNWHTIGSSGRLCDD